MHANGGGARLFSLVGRKVLRANPKYINYLAPFVTYSLTLLAGTGHTSFSVLPVIVEVAKGQKIRPCRPLSLAVVASQVGITASPVSAAVITMSAFVEPLGVSYPLLLSLIIPSSFLGCALAAFIVSTFLPSHLEGAVALQATKQKELPEGARLSVLIFVVGIVAVVLYATAISKNVGWIAPVHLPRNGAIMAFMLTIAACIVFFCKVKCNDLVQTSTFKAGLSACVCVLGVAWLGDTFVKGYIEPIKIHAAAWITHYPFTCGGAVFYKHALIFTSSDHKSTHP
ncbi:hypothetical protein NHP21005_06790 [Helicobacter sp. NHP21005]|nr:hypothetical protein NHP21005_06790 [Helicobacter sp. NHP21005]